MKNKSAGKALKISVPAVIILIVLKLISMFINGNSEGPDETEYIPEITLSLAEEAVTSSEYVTSVSVTENEEEITEFTSAFSAEVSDSEPEITVSADGTVTAVYQEYTEYVFRNSTLLNNHYKKHGVEMGFESAAEYEKAASDVVNSSSALHKKEKEDNDDVYYIEATNEFVVVSSDGYLRTYFLPDKGKDYFDRQ